MARHLLFSLAVLAQLVILAVKPAEKLIVRHVTGRLITLRTRPVDPYDVMRGYYMTLSYEISEPPGFAYRDEDRGETVYTVLEKGADEVWKAISLSDRLPAELRPGQAVIRGFVTARWQGPVKYGIEEYYVPEDKRHEIEEAMRKERQRILVDVAVDRKGRSSVLRLHVGDKAYEY